MDHKKDEKSFQQLCMEYLSTCGLDDLRCYGRTLNLPYPTRLKKQELITEIIRSLNGEQLTQRNNRGAPIKKHYFSPEIPNTIEKIKRQITTQENIACEQSNENIPTETVKLNLSITMDQLTQKQKELLTAFLDSL